MSQDLSEVEAGFPVCVCAFTQSHCFEVTGCFDERVVDVRMSVDFTAVERKSGRVTRTGTQSMR